MVVLFVNAVHMRAARPFVVRRQLPLELVASVLEPDLHLGLGQVERAGELGSLGYGEVLLLAKLALQGQQLRGSEGRARFTVVFMLS